MIVLDFRPYGKELTLDKCAKLFDEVYFNDYDKKSILTFPDKCWITEWQSENIFSTLSGKWQSWRDIPLVVRD